MEWTKECQLDTLFLSKASGSEIRGVESELKRVVDLALGPSRLGARGPKRLTIGGIILEDETVRHIVGSATSLERFGFSIGGRDLVS